MSGYVRLHRTLIGHPAFRNDAEALAFAWMIMRAAWKPARVRYRERLIHLKRGQLAISQRDMAASLDRDKAWVERLWRRLKSEAMIEVATEAGVAVITVCKYSTYQADGADREAVDEAQPEAGARQGQGTEQEREEGKKKRSGAAASGSRLPADFVVPEDWLGWAAAERNWDRKTVEIEAASFVDHWKAKAGKDGRRLDWLATWRNWVRGSRRPDGEAKVTPINRGPMTAEQLHSAIRFHTDRDEPEQAEAFRQQLAELTRARATGPPNQSIGDLAAKALRGMGSAHAH